MKKVLVIVHVGRHLRLFSHADAKIYYDLGCEVHFAANFTGIQDTPPQELSSKYILHQVDFSRTPFSFKNIRAYYQLKKIIKSNDFDVVHTHMAVAGVIGRLASKKTSKVKIVHTSHGFAFYKGRNYLTNCLYKMIEMKMARITNYLITMNLEDYEIAKRMKMIKPTLGIFLINGVGIDLKRYDNKIMSEKIPIEIDLKNSKVLVTVGELSKRKNQLMLIKAMKYLPNDYHLLICGTGRLIDKYNNYIQKHCLADRVFLLGYRKDVIDILKNSHVFVFSSKAEGLPVSVLEAMSMGLPIVASNVRGNNDLIVENENGYLFDNNDVNMYVNIIKSLFGNPVLIESMSKKSLEFVKKYSIDEISKQLSKIYELILIGEEHNE